MKIIFFGHEFPPFGGEAGEALTSLLLEYSKNPELEIDFVTFSTDEKYHTSKIGNNIVVHQIPVGNDAEKNMKLFKKESISLSWKAYKFSRKLVKQNKYDLSHVFSSKIFGVVALMLKAEFKLPYVVSLQGSDSDGLIRKNDFSKQMNSFAAKKIFAKSSFLIANSLWLKNFALSTNPGKEIEVIYNGFDADVFFPDIRKRVEGKFEILCVSKIIPQKGVRFLIQAFKILSGRYEQIRLTIVGDGSEIQSLKDLARGLGLEERAKFIGEVDHKKVFEYYQKSNLFVLPFAGEGISKVVLESVACGLPVVIPDTLWARELLKENANALFAKKDDADDLAEKIEKLILNKSLLEEIAKNNLARANDFTWKSISAQYLDVYVKTRNISRIQD